MNTKVLWLSLGFLTGGSALVYANNMDELVHLEPMQKGEHKALKEDVIEKENEVKVVAQGNKVQESKIATPLTVLKTDQHKDKSLVKVNGSFSMMPCAYYAHKLWHSSNKLCLGLKVQADNNNYSDQFLNGDIEVALQDKGVSFTKVLGTLKWDRELCGCALHMGYGPSIFGAVAKVRQVSGCVWTGVIGDVYRNLTLTFESPHEVTVGKISDDKELVFTQQKFSLPAWGFNYVLGVGKWVMDFTCFNRYILGKLNQGATELFETFGANFSVQCKVLKDALTLKLGGLYASGLGDYISEVVALQNDKDSNGVCSVYVDHSRLIKLAVSVLTGSLEFCMNPNWVVLLNGSYLSILNDNNHVRKGNVLNALYNITPKLSYKLNKYITLSGGCTFNQEQQCNGQDGTVCGRPLSYTLFSSINWSF